MATYASARANGHFQWIMLPGREQKPLPSAGCPWADNSVWFARFWTFASETIWDWHIHHHVEQQVKWGVMSRSPLLKEFKRAFGESSVRWLLLIEEEAPLSLSHSSSFGNAEWFRSKMASSVCFIRGEAHGGSVAFTGHGCPHSFTECITTIFIDEVILFPSKWTDRDIMMSCRMWPQTAQIA